MNGKKLKKKQEKFNLQYIKTKRYLYILKAKH
jgi:hypothetical protein